MSDPKSLLRNRRLYGALSVGILLAAVVVSKVLMSTAPTAERKHPQRLARLVDVTVVHAGPQAVTVSAYGQVESSQQVQLSAQVAGIITGLGAAFVPGQRVRKGELLAQIDPQDFQLALDSARANLTTAEASLAIEQGNQAVARGDVKLLDLSASQQEESLMLREPQLKSAQAAVDAARAAVSRARLDLARTAVLAPFDALVLQRKVGVGTQVNARTTVLGELAAAAPFWVKLLLPVENLQWIALPGTDGRPGAEVDLADATQPTAAPWHGRVIELIDAVETEGRRAQLLVQIDPPTDAATQPLLLGTYVQARIHGRSLEHAFRLDPAWLHGDQVWVVRDGRLASITVDVRFRDEESALVTGGLQDGDRVVSSLLSGAVDGMRVRTPDEPSPPQTPAAPDATGTTGSGA